ncbi:MAG TPA: acyltransferase domain-containing protein, partial [Polyangia bacterium]
AAAGQVALGSIKSQIGHLKSAAGAAGLLKTVLALHHKVLPPTINVREPIPALGLGRPPLALCREARPWERPAAGAPRRAAVSSFGFGGTNFHVVLEEHVPGMLTEKTGGGGASGKKPTSTSTATATATANSTSTPTATATATGFVVIGGESVSELRPRLEAALAGVRAGRLPGAANPAELTAAERIAIAYADAPALAQKLALALANLGNDARVWRALRGRGLFRGAGAAPKVAFLFPGQGSQSVGMLRALYDATPEARSAFAEADAVMTAELGRPLTDFVFAPPSPAADEALRATTVCQPAMLAADLALMRVLARHGVAPDMVMGHSLGEYAALIAAGALPFADALAAVSGRAREMTSVSFADNGRMASIFAPEAEVRRILAEVAGYVVTANLNSRNQTVIGGATAAVEEAVARFTAAGAKAVLLPVSHAFHTAIVAPASEPLRGLLARLRFEPPRLPIISNVTGEPYPDGPDARPAMLDLLGRQVAAPVQFARGLETLYRLGARVFVEVGPRRVLASFVEDVLGDRDDVVALCTNQSKKGDLESLAEALAGLAAAGLGAPRAEAAIELARGARGEGEARSTTRLASGSPPGALPGEGGRAEPPLNEGLRSPAPAARPVRPAAAPAAELGSIVISGAAVGLPGRARPVFAEDNFARLLAGEGRIDAIDEAMQQRMVDKHIVRLHKSSDGSGELETIADRAGVLKLAGQRGAFDLVAEFGLEAERADVFDITTQLAVGAAVLALRDAGIPLVRRYRQTTRGTLLPDRWVLPEGLADETGVIFASAFPGLDRLLDEVGRGREDEVRRAQLQALEEVRAGLTGAGAAAVDARVAALRAELRAAPYTFDRKFLFHVLSMGHAQVAELVGARGPNTQVNSACASGAMALGVAEDWIRRGRCRRVIVVSADDVTSDRMLEWFGAGFLASGAATTEADVTRAALPFDRRRHGLIVGMGASGIVVETEDAVRERGMRGIAELLAVELANSAFHGSRLDVAHIGQVMERLVARVERERGLDRAEVAGETVFVSHETYTPARGGSAAAEIHSLRGVFGAAASQVLIANTKGMTGHPMGAGIEDAVAVKILETGVVPPVPNLKEPDPELGDLRLSPGGRHPARFALRFAAGFGSQVAITLMGKVRGPRVADRAGYEQWLAACAGRPAATTEVAQNTLRVRDDGPPARSPAPSTWAPGTPPSARAELAEREDATGTGTGTGTATNAATGTPPTAVAPAAAVAAPGTGTGTGTATNVHADDVADRLLALVAGKTGYPREMLALDLDLEADLGIDTVKQAEIFAELRSGFGLPRRADLKLRDYPTLGHLIKLVGELRGGSASASTTPVAPAAAAAAPGTGTGTGTATSVHADDVAARLLALVAGKTGYPTDMLALDLDLEADLGIDTVKQAEIFAELRSGFGLPRREDL